MHTLANMLSAHRAEILDAWATEAQKAAAARGLTRPELMNIMPVYLGSLAKPGADHPNGEQIELIEIHLSSRLRAGFNLDELLEEFAVLGRVIVRVWSALPPEERPDGAEIDRLFDDLQAATTVVTQAFRQYLLEDEQTEKRYLRLLHIPFGPPIDGEAPLSPARLERALVIINEAMGADTAALLLHDPTTHDLVMTASVGLAGEPFAQYVRSVDAASFVGSVARGERVEAMRDVETTPLDVPETLRHSGVHAVLGVRLPPQRTLMGVLYIGLRATRAFSAREARRIEALAEQLALLLDNARLQSELLDRVTALNVERALRSQFVSVLAHDLRGPLAVARLTAQSLAGQPPAAGSDPSAKVERILRNLDRVTRMTTDLLDADRIHAGKPLVLHLEDTDLGAVARDVVDELSLEHPGRFVLHADEGVRGRWGAAELRRALWNLASNALKYGAAGASITVAITRRADGVEASVHNEGAPIPPEAQARLFEPFERAIVTGGAQGWGLGLALVRSCAEAHGGSVLVDSAAGRGTMFTLRLPWVAAAQAA